MLVMTAAEAERLLRRVARNQRKGWTVDEVRGQRGRRRGKGSHKNGSPGRSSRSTQVIYRRG